MLFTLVAAQQIPLFQSTSLRLISLKEGHEQWMNEQEITKLYQTKTKFIDVTDHDLDSLQFQMVSDKFPTQAQHKDQVKSLFPSIDVKAMEEFLTTFSGFHTRYYKSTSGKESSEWLLHQVEDLEARSDIRFSVKKFKHPWAQSSVIARIEPLELKTNETVILSAHQDSVNQFNPWFGRSPGADDNGSGSTTIFEALRVLLKSDWVPNKIVEFHWYSAEEAGLLGSQKVVQQYVKEKREVYAVYHNDMTGYLSEDIKPTFGLVTDYVNKGLSKALEMIVDTYLSIGWAYTKCGYACSDHASWTKVGIPSTFSFEGPFEKSSPFIHTTQDTVAHINFEHMAEFVKAVIAFAVELSA
ncbi:hypothetical protein EDD86DRAFT_190055 [Gorgonomyces haynaldii]|nr:hypothetical protein EDD86DRAFT_190055 [Gorgonomyces haynaldii]